MKKVYSFDDNNNFVSFDYVEETYELNEHETDTPIPDGLYEPIKFDAVSNTWLGLTADEFAAQNTQLGDSIISKAEMISSLMQQLAIFQISQNETNAKLLQQVALLQSEKGVTNG